MKKVTTKRKYRLADLPQKQILWGIVGSIALAFLFYLIFSLFFSRPISTQPIQEVIGEHKQIIRHPLTGEWLEQEIALPNVFAVMIDNHVDARPQSGIDQAFLVIEAPVEAGISRMIAFFDAQQEVEKIGPVRSARPYFLDWNNEFDALYAHVGGSNEALEKIGNGGTFDLNEYAHGSSFWRASTRSAPHNAYTSSSLMRSYLETRTSAGLAPNVLYESWIFKDPEPVSASDQIYPGVEIDFWAPVYTVEWSFDSERGLYERAQAGVKDLTLDHAPIVAHNVVVMITDVTILDTVGRRAIKTIGEGQAWVLQDGKKIQAVWKKPSVSERLRFFVGDQEVSMNAGNTWIEVVPSIHDVTFEPREPDPDLVNP